MQIKIATIAAIALTMSACGAPTPNTTLLPPLQPLSGALPHLYEGRGPGHLERGHDCLGPCLACADGPCLVDIIQSYQPYTAAGFVDIWSGRVVIWHEDYGATLNTTPLRMSTCPKDLRAGAVFTIAMDTDSSIGLFGFNTSVTSPESCYPNGRPEDTSQP